MNLDKIYKKSKNLVEKYLDEIEIGQEYEIFLDYDINRDDILNKIDISEIDLQYINEKLIETLEKNKLFKIEKIIWRQDIIQLELILFKKQHIIYNIQLSRIYQNKENPNDVYKNIRTEINLKRKYIKLYEIIPTSIFYLMQSEYIRYREDTVFNIFTLYSLFNDYFKNNKYKYEYLKEKKIDVKVLFSFDKENIKKYTIRNKYIIMVVNDESIYDDTKITGEIITPVMTFNEIIDFHKLIVQFQKEYDGYFCKECGVHFNISHKGYNYDDVLNKFNILNFLDTYYEELWIEIFRRDNNQWIIPIMDGIRRIVKNNKISKQERDSVLTVLTKFHHNSIHIREYQIEYRIQGNYVQEDVRLIKIYLYSLIYSYIKTLNLDNVIDKK